MLCHICGKLRQPASVKSVSSLWSRKCQRFYSMTLKHSTVMAVQNNFQCVMRKLCPATHRIQMHSTSSLASKWERPKGYDTGIKIYHPLVKDKVPFILQQESIAQWYACGPTVYDSSHLGHASSYVRQDIIRRILGSVFDIDTTLVMCVTDVDDKLIKKANETGQEMGNIARFYEAEFFANMANLNVSPPSVVTRVTEHIPRIIQFIMQLENKGFAYRVKDGSVYFDVKQYGRYGVFSTPQESEIPPGERESEKKNTRDFALWKGSKPGEPWWVSPWGKGRPGWHIECSVMASGIFGANFDLHTGGEDLMFPHHENEIAQSCAYHDNTQWANYWLHTGHLFLSGQKDKMSKSLKNVISVAQFLEDYTPNHMRMLCLLHNYKKRIEFSSERMQKAVSTMSVFNSIINRCDAYVKGQIDCVGIPEAELYERLHVTKQAVHRAYADDFNTPQALAHVMRLVKYVNQFFGEQADKEEEMESNVRSNAAVAAVGVYVRRVLKQLGLDIGRKKAEEETETHLQFYKAVEAVVSSRTRIRDFAKDKHFMVKTADEVGIPKDQAVKLMKKLYQPLWETSDKIRADILSKANVQINDDISGSTWSIVDSKRKPSTDSQEGREIDVKKLEESNKPDEKESKGTKDDLIQKSSPS